MRKKIADSLAAFIVILLTGWMFDLNDALKLPITEMTGDQAFGMLLIVAFVHTWMGDLK